MHRSWLVVVVVVAAGCGDQALVPAAPPAVPPAAPRLAPAALAPPCPPAAPAAATSLQLAPVRFADLPGWRDDRVDQAVPALLASCAVLASLPDGAAIGARPYSGTAGAWRAACRAAAALPVGDTGAARAFFERELRPYATSAAGEPTGKLTAYYVQALRGSRTRHGAYQVPILARPADLVAVDLGQFDPELGGRRIWGRLDRTGLALEPYPSRHELRVAGAPGARVLLWADDPVDVLFAEIEGSGRVAVDDGSTVWLGFAGKNGRRFRGAGGILRQLGELGPGQGTMQGIRAWFAAHPDRVDDIADRNPAKVFFQESDRPGAVGTEGVVLTPRRSLAVDRSLIALSTPVWVDTRAPAGTGVAPWRHLVVAQDTGGAILGPVRGDLYFGADAAAADEAGRTGGPGQMWLLLPRALVVPAVP